MKRQSRYARSAGLVAVALGLLALLVAGGQPLTRSAKASLARSEAPPVATGADTCDATLWKHVYHPTRLKKKTACVTVTGTIVDATNGKRKDGVRHEADGDTHGWLKVDPEFEKLLNAGNKSNEGGNLVFEIICKFPVTQADAKAACKGFKSSVTIPAVGSRVAITGTYVQDTNHAKWMEIHPVTSIVVQ